ncbi:MAG: transporter substrate-binding domain-containing protein [Aquabacterium sp.]|jgi:polar amino acid transport system substrate-binding protein|nr:MAG: transporter substrate-binding domain-containing protein [Aquabacterium sp.]
MHEATRQDAAANRSTRRWPAAWLAVAFAALAATAMAAPEKILLAAEDDWPPYSSVRGDRSGPEGFAVDVVREAFATQGVQVGFVVVPFARCMLMARTGEALGCFDATVLDDNRDTYHWHETPMFHEELAVFGRAGGSRRDMTLANLEGSTVGYTVGYTYPPAFFRNPKIRRVSAKSDRVLLEMLNAGRVDYILANTAPAYLRINASAKFKGRVEKVGSLSVDGFWIAFTRADPKGKRMALVFERGLQALKADGRYDTMQAAFRKRVGF